MNNGGERRPDVWKTPQVGDIVKIRSGTFDIARMSQVNMLGTVPEIDEIRRNPDQLYKVISVRDTTEVDEPRAVQLRRVTVESAYITVAGRKHEYMKYVEGAILEGITPQIENIDLIERSRG